MSKRVHNAEAADVVALHVRDDRRRILIETTREALHGDDEETLRLILNDQHPSDLGQVFRVLDADDQRRTVELLGELDRASIIRVADALRDEPLSDIVDEMEPAAAAGVLAKLPHDTSERVLGLTEEGEADEVRQLMSHPQETGGGIMTSRLLAVSEQVTIAEATQNLRSTALDNEDLLAVSVVDAGQRLIGVASLRSMLLASTEATMGSIADHEVMLVLPQMDQEEIAALFADYNRIVMPVVDEGGVLIGQVTVDDIVDVIRDEATEGMVRLAATSSAEREERSVFGVMRRRLPWLLLCLVGTLLSGGVLEHVDRLLTAKSSLVLFVPAIMAMGGVIQAFRPPQ